LRSRIPATKFLLSLSFLLLSGSTRFFSPFFVVNFPLADAEKSLPPWTNPPPPATFPSRFSSFGTSLNYFSLFEDGFLVAGCSTTADSSECFEQALFQGFSLPSYRPSFSFFWRFSRVLKDFFSRYTTFPLSPCRETAIFLL